VRTLRVLKVQQLQRRITLEGTLEVPQLSVNLQERKISEAFPRDKKKAVTHLGDDGLLDETLADAEGDGEGGGLVTDTLLDGSVGKSDLDRLAGHGCEFDERSASAQRFSSDQPLAPSGATSFARQERKGRLTGELLVGLLLELLKEFDPRGEKLGRRVELQSVHARHDVASLLGLLLLLNLFGLAGGGDGSSLDGDSGCGVGRLAGGGDGVGSGHSRWGGREVGEVRVDEGAGGSASQVEGRKDWVGA
jgi:hypothetical protein